MVIIVEEAHTGVYLNFWDKMVEERGVTGKVVSGRISVVEYAWKIIGEIVFLQLHWKAANGIIL